MPLNPTEPYCAFLVVIATALVSFRGFRDQGFEARNLFDTTAILMGREYHRLVTSGFLHRDVVHLLMNMSTLALFGSDIELFLGRGDFLVIYFGSMLGGGLLALFVHRHHEYQAYGASGAVVGVMFAHILLFPGGRLGAFLLPFLTIPAWAYGIAYLAYSFYAMHSGHGDIGHEAHLGGALSGTILAALLQPMLMMAHPLWFGGVSAAALLLMWYLSKNPLLLSFKGVDFTKERVSRPEPRPRRSFFRRRTSETPSAKAQKIDDILQKIARDGLDSLTPGERRTLNEASVKFQRRAQCQKPRWYFPF